MAVDAEMEDFLIAEKRHREIISTIKGMVKEMPKTEIDFSSLESFKVAIEKLLDSQGKQKETNENEALIFAVKGLNDNLRDSISQLKDLIKKSNEPKQFEFSIERKYDDKITKVIAKTI